MPDAPPPRGEPSPRYQGPTYYGRPQVKPAPFHNAFVGTYIFLAGLSGASQLIALAADIVNPERARRLVRRARYLALAGTAAGAPLLVADLHTPRRFYNMLRIFRPTSPMSVGSWILTGFGALSAVTATIQLVTDMPGLRRLRFLGRLSRFAQIPAALAGAGIGTYTASLLSATSTPLWAAAPRATGIRFAASSIASGAAAMAIGERRVGGDRLARDLDTLALAALAVDLAATRAAERSYAEKGITAADSRANLLDRVGGQAVGIHAPMALHVAASLTGDRRLMTLADTAILLGSLCMRIGILGAGEESARRPRDAMSLAQPRNLPARHRSRR